MYRLTDEVVTDAVNGDYSANYVYDKVGNRTYETVDGVETAYTYDLNYRLLQQGGTVYTYDLNGNTLTETLDGNVITYSYNSKNKLVSVDKAGLSAQYTYNSNGIRTSKTEAGVTTNYVIDANQAYAQVLLEDNGTDTVIYTFGDDLISQDRNSNASFYLYDGLGSTRALTDALGEISDTYDYKAFGELLNSTGSTENNFLFTGEQFDESLDHYYLRARYYDAGQGRFTQMDTYMGEDPEPLTLHKYVYGGNDPILMIDYSGNSYSMVDVGVAFAGVATLTTIGYLGGQNGIAVGGSPGNGYSDKDLGLIYITALMVGSQSNLLSIVGTKSSTDEDSEKMEELFHGTPLSNVADIKGNGFNEAPMFFAEEKRTAEFFGESQARLIGGGPATVFEFKIPESLVEKLGLDVRYRIGEYRNLPPVDIYKGSGYERVLVSSSQLTLFNGAVKSGIIQYSTYNTF